MHRGEGEGSLSWVYELGYFSVRSSRLYISYRSVLVLEYGRHWGFWPVSGVKPGEIPTESNYRGVWLIQFEKAFNPTRAFGVSHVRGDRAY